MKHLLRIKWETILTLIMLAITIYGWVVYIRYLDDVRVLAMACITTFMFMIVFFGQNTIKEARRIILASMQ